MVDHEITITVLAISGNQVRLGVKAPREVPVYRGEIYEKIQRARSDM